jgi:hypothetical protein
MTETFVSKEIRRQRARDTNAALSDDFTTRLVQVASAPMIIKKTYTGDPMTVTVAFIPALQCHVSEQLHDKNAKIKKHNDIKSVEIIVFRIKPNFDRIKLLTRSSKLGLQWHSTEL